MPTPGTLDVVWCIPRGVDREVIAFAFDGPAEWVGTRDLHRDRGNLYLRPAGGGAIAFFLSGPDTVDAWLAEITGNEASQVLEAEAATLTAPWASVVDAQAWCPEPATDA